MHFGGVRRFGGHSARRPVVLPLIVCYLLFSTLFRIRSHTARSIAAFGLAAAGGAAVALGFHMTALAVACVLVCSIVIIKHVRKRAPFKTTPCFSRSPTGAKSAAFLRSREKYSSASAPCEA